MRGHTVDLHAHPTMKTFYAGKDFTKSSKTSKGFNPFTLRTNLPSLQAGGVGVIWSAIYVPEKPLIKDCKFIGAASFAVKHLRRTFKTAPKAMAVEIIEHMNRTVAEARSKGHNVVVAKSLSELEAARSTGDTALVHTLEGAHVLENDVASVDYFASLGVASITLAHFYDNGIAPPVDSIPDDFILKRLGCFKAKEDLTKGLSATGHQVVERMYDIGMIVDLTHCTPKARADVYAIANERARPLVMTHVGAHSLNAHPMNPTDEEIRGIANTGGVIGVIFYSDWLVGHAGVKRSGDTVEHVVDTVKHLVNAGGEDCVSFGSDFDGMTDPPDDLSEPSGFGVLADRLSRAGFNSGQVEKFMGKNAMRVLEAGWR